MRDILREHGLVAFLTDLVGLVAIGVALFAIIVVASSVPA